MIPYLYVLALGVLEREYSDKWQVVLAPREYLTVYNYIRTTVH